MAFDTGAVAHLAVIDSKYHSMIRATISQQLRHEPNRATRNRKPLKSPASFGASWELRFGPGNRFRVLDHVDETQHEVLLLAIGIKERNRLMIGGREVKE